jgi:hypothetical protein
VRAHGQRIARADEDSAPAHVDGVPLDELLDVLAPELDPEVDGGTWFFGLVLFHGGGRDSLNHLMPQRSSLSTIAAVRRRHCRAGA